MTKISLVACAAFPLLLLASSAHTAPVGDAELRSSDKDAGNWLMYGRTYDDHRFSPLNQINEQSIGNLAWPGAASSARHVDWRRRRW